VVVVRWRGSDRCPRPRWRPSLGSDDCQRWV